MAMRRSIFTVLGLGAIFLFASAMVTPPGTRAQGHTDAGEITAVLEAQAAAWNRGDLESFMAGYWKSDQTIFVGANGLARGWQAVYERYQKGYPDRKAMGQLSFSDMEVHQTCPDAAFVVGQFHLVRENDKPSGIFTLNLRKFADGWKVVADHTTAFAAPSPK
jgi:ketosteroid isomerase-like protein